MIEVNLEALNSEDAREALSEFNKIALAIGIKFREIGNLNTHARQSSNQSDGYHAFTYLYDGKNGSTNNVSAYENEESV